MSTDPKVEQIFNAMDELRQAGDGPRARKLLDALFRNVHSLKANASANGLNGLATAAHEFENVLHSLRTGAADDLSSNAIPAGVWSDLKQEQKHTVNLSLAEGARLFLVHASFDVADFDREFQSLKERLNKTGEVISTTPRVDNEQPGKVTFKILYAAQSTAPEISGVTIEEIATPRSTLPSNTPTNFETLNQAFEKFSAELTGFATLPSGDVFEQVLRAGRFAALATGKQVDFEVRNQDLKLDEAVCAVVADPLVHLVRNAIHHGIEPSDKRIQLGKNPRGKIVIEAIKLEGQTTFIVTDDGRGIDPSSLPKIFNPGFSTATEISELAGRGVGLDAVKTQIEEAGGSVTVTTHPGHGSTFQITLPNPA